jgi:uncharacterized protein (TIGR03663 family)
VRRRPSARPITPAQPAVAAPAGAVQWEGRSYSSPLARAFPFPTSISLELVFFVSLMAVTIFLRLWMLGDRPLHHDESLHATYSWDLVGSAHPEYHYDPMMHGPLQFHMIAFFYALFGSSVFTARLWSVTAGTALVFVPLLLRRQLGAWATYVLMIILCVSPTTLYFSRFAREDMQYGLFTMLLVASIIRYFLDRRDGYPYHYRWLYVVATSFIMAYAAKESIYLTTAVLGSFILAALAMEVLEGYWWIGPGAGVVIMAGGLVAGKLSVAVLGVLIIAGVVLLQMWATGRQGLVADALRSSPLRAWLLSAGIVVTLFVFLYWPVGDPASWAFIPGTHMVPTTLDIPVAGGNDVTKSYTYSTDGLIGGLQYWQAQQPVARGGQPWYYYFLIIPMYEWLVTLFGIIGAIYVLRRQRTFWTLFILWWTIATIGIYCWTSEKMPWNSLHLVIPLSVLAAIGVVAGVTHATRWVRYLAIAAAAITALVSIHNSFTIAYVTGAQPVEYYVYVQTTPDVPEVYSEMQRIQAHLNGQPLHIQVDNEDTWPWAFYLRDGKQWYIDAYPSTPKDFGVPTEPVLFVSDDNYAQMSAELAPNYVAIHEHLRWWNPEEYKTYNQAGVSPWSNFTHFIHDALMPSTWLHVMQWEIQRRPFSPGAWNNFNNSTNFYFMVNKQYVQYLSPAVQAQVKAQQAAQQQADPFLTLNRPLQASAVVAGVGAGPKLNLLTVAPIAAGAAGDVLVGDITAHKIVHVAPNGAFAGSWGSAGTGPGQFSNNPDRSPSIGGIAYAPDGDVYATDTWNGRVEEFTPGGTFIRAWGQLSQDPSDTKPFDLFGPRGIAVASNGDVYVADTGHETIKVFSATGAFLFSFGGLGGLHGDFNEPSSVAIDRAGDVYVADYWNQRIQVFTAQGQFLRQINVPSWQNNYHEPQIAVDAQGRVYAPDPANSRILVFGANGQPLMAFGSLGLGLNQMNQPLGVAVGPHNTILVSDAGNARVLRFTVP